MDLLVIDDSASNVEESKSQSVNPSLHKSTRARLIEEFDNEGAAQGAEEIRAASKENGELDEDDGADEYK